MIRNPKQTIYTIYLKIVNNIDINKNKIGLRNKNINSVKKLEVFGGHLFSEDDHSNWTPPYWNITTETFSLDKAEL